MEASNERYKVLLDISIWYQVFSECDLVMVYVRRDRFPIWTYHNLKYKKIGPCRVLKKINDNSYDIDLKAFLDVFPIFNVSNLYTFHGEYHDDDNDDEALYWQW